VVRGFLVVYSVWLISSLAAILILAFFVRKPNASLLKRRAFAALGVILVVIWYIDFRLPHHVMRYLAAGRLSLAAFNSILLSVKIAVNVLFGIAVGVLVFAFENGRGKSNRAEPGAVADRPRDQGSSDSAPTSA